MTPADQTELYAADTLLLHARQFAKGALPDDFDAVTLAVMCRALELATPGWSAEARARLFMPEELPPSSLEQEYDLATYGDWISDANQ